MSPIRSYLPIRMLMDAYGTSNPRTCRNPPVRSSEQVLLQRCFARHLWLLVVNGSGQYPCMTFSAAIHVDILYGAYMDHHGPPTKRGYQYLTSTKWLVMAQDGSKLIKRIQPYSICFILQSGSIQDTNGYRWIYLDIEGLSPRKSQERKRTCPGPYLSHSVSKRSVQCIL